MATVKNAVLHAIKDAVEGITGMGKVWWNLVTNVDLETVVLPAAVISDGPITLTPRNEWGRGEFPLLVEVYFEAKDTEAGEALSDSMDAMEEKVHTALVFGDAIQLAGGSVHVDPEQTYSERQFIEEFVGRLVMRFKVVYHHRWSDPSDSVRS